MPDREQGSLGAVGLDDEHELVYRLLLESRGATLAELRARCRLPERRLRGIVDALSELGLISRSAAKPPRYVPAPPDVAVDMLILDREQALSHARLAVAELAEVFRRSAGMVPSPEIVEVVSGREAVFNRERQLLGGAKSEILGFIKPPFDSPDEAWTKWKLKILGRGVTGRVVYSIDSLDVPGIMNFIRTVGHAGEESRVAEHLPTNALIVDGSAALLPLRFDGPGGGYTHLLVRTSSLLDALILLFDSVWNGATPLSVPKSADPLEPAELSEEEHQVLVLLAAGMNDADIARRLGIGRRTVERRIRTTMDRLGVRTRLQTGVEASRRGWI